MCVSVQKGKKRMSGSESERLLEGQEESRHIRAPAHVVSLVSRQNSNTGKAA